MRFLPDAAELEAFKIRINRVPATDEEFIECLQDKWWRINNLYTVKNKQGKLVPFKINEMQMKVALCKHNRQIILKSRQVGMSTLKLIESLDDALFEPNKTNGVMAQGLDEASELLEKARCAWDHLHVSVKRYLGLLYSSKGMKMNTVKTEDYEGPVVELILDNTTEYGFNNGSKLMVRTSFRSGTLQRLHVSELGKIAAKDPKKAYELKTGTFQAIGDERPVTVESTAEGRSGYFYELWNIAMNMLLSGAEFSCLDFVPIFISWVEDPDCVLHTPKVLGQELEAYFESIEKQLRVKLTPQQKYFYASKKAELGAHITQEYPSTPEEAFQATRDGSVYGPEMKELRASGRIVPNLYDPNLPVYFAMDLGMRDLFVIVFWQCFEGQTRIIGEYVNHRVGLEHYCEYLYSTGFRYARMFGPHDLANQDLMGGGRTRLDIFQEYGIPMEVLPKIPVADGIQAVKLMLANTWIDESCKWVIDSLDNYSYAWDDMLGHWKKEPIHNKWSHGADAVRYMATSGCVNFSQLQIFHMDGKRSLVQKTKKRKKIFTRYDV